MDQPVIGRLIQTSAITLVTITLLFVHYMVRVLLGWHLASLTLLATAVIPFVIGGV